MRESALVLVNCPCICGARRSQPIASISKSHTDRREVWGLGSSGKIVGTDTVLLNRLWADANLTLLPDIEILVFSI